MKKAKRVTHRLMNAERMARLHPDTFHIHDKAARMGLRPGQSAKVCTGGERFWVKITLADANGRYAGQVDNLLLFVPNLDYGDVITFQAKHVLDIFEPTTA